MRKRILIAIGMTFASLVLILYLVARVILMESFTELEKQYVHRDMQRAQSALSDELDDLDTLLLDCAARDDTYTFVEDTNEEYIESNLTYETFTDSRLDLILFVNSSGQTVFGTSFRENRKAPVPQSLQEHLTEDALLNHPNNKSSIRGIVLIPEGPLLIASRPILTSEKAGPMRGTMIVGRYLDSAQLERLAQITHLSLALHRLDDAQMPRDFQAARSSLPLSTMPARPQEMPVFVQPLNGESVAGYTLLKDIYGNPSLMLRVDMPRDIYRRGQASMLYLVFLLLFGGMAFTGMTSWVADKVLISRL
ncbi:MAG: histidine kinase, partial [Chloroflexi bacterium]|nr:histidine kinase [Chloroflexota bacterium]